MVEGNPPFPAHVKYPDSIAGNHQGSPSQNPQTPFSRTMLIRKLSVLVPTAICSVYIVAPATSTASDSIAGSVQALVRQGPRNAPTWRYLRDSEACKTFVLLRSDPLEPWGHGCLGAAYYDVPYRVKLEKFQSNVEIVIGRHRSSLRASGLEKFIPPSMEGKSTRAVRLM
ncbi:hypothetical protein BDV37DRAFT_287510 [Aspergillus pseudonomiae]|uniref:Uncharacterized protein n=1 Tax=Aspergillus pseudonomiae TaxID=1506151 RepID=A0A5N7CZA1_9EURO|nr:uncharacterized protein BDV37DRAFT_287510 [Aspergillus pseudonomiae]KAE8399491.1 hypothetical protein BDV37DRAFT_287510 [Aspergillus pseudonomiae]